MVASSSNVLVQSSYLSIDKLPAVSIFSPFYIQSGPFWSLPPPFVNHRMSRALESCRGPVGWELGGYFSTTERKEAAGWLIIPLSRIA